MRYFLVMYLLKELALLALPSLLSRLPLALLLRTWAVIVQEIQVSKLT